MKRTPEQAARVAAWLNMLDHCEAQLQALRALPGVRGKLSVANARIRVLESEARENTATSEQVTELRERAEVLSYNLKVMVEHDAKMRGRRILRARKSRETIEGLHREVARFADMAQANADRAKQLEHKAKHSEERRLELLALAQELGCDCVHHKMLEAVRKLKAGR